jgi:hypothetical protein
MYHYQSSFIPACGILSLLLCLYCDHGIRLPNQTKGADLLEPARVSGEVGLHRARLIEFVEQQGIVLEFNERIAQAQGASCGGKIILLPGQSEAEEFATLVHEVAHEMLHRAEQRIMTTKTVRETVAEAIAIMAAVRSRRDGTRRLPVAAISVTTTPGYCLTTAQYNENTHRIFPINQPYFYWRNYHDW